MSFLKRPGRRRHDRHAWERSGTTCDEHTFFVLGVSATLFEGSAAQRARSESTLAWNGDVEQQMDRYDARLLLSELGRYESSRERRLERPSPEPWASEDEAEAERYLNLPPEHQQDIELPLMNHLPPQFGTREGEEGAGEEIDADRAGAAIGFDYREDGGWGVRGRDSPDQHELYQPPYLVPEHLQPCLPQTERLNSIMLSTAALVRKHVSWSSKSGRKNRS